MKHSGTGLVIAFAGCLLAPALAWGTTPDTLVLDGNDNRVVVPHHDSLNPVSGITIEAWIRPTAASQFPTIVGKDFWTGTWFGLNESGRLRYYTNGIGTYEDGTDVIPLGQWTHVAVTFDGSVRNYYINGVRDHSSFTPGDLPTNVADLGIGAEASGAFPFIGTMADVRIWEVARTQDDIRQNLDRQLTEAEPGLVAAWPLEGSADDALGNNPGVVAGGAFFGGPAAPPEPGDPMLIRRLGVIPTVDGNCALGEYGAQRLPLWYEGVAKDLVWAYVGATSTDIYVCIDNMDRGYVTDSFASVSLDLQDDGGSVATFDDLRFLISEGGTVLYEQGDSSGEWESTFPPAGSVDIDTNGAIEFVWDAEFRLSRSLLDSSTGPFALQVMQHRLRDADDDHEYPDGSSGPRPSSWRSVIIDDDTAPRPDARAPSVVVGHLPSDGDLRPGDSVQIEARASDDTDLQTVEIYVDYSLVEACDYPGSNDLYPTPCAHDGAYELGAHTYYARAIDHRGRITISEVRSFAVHIDGEAPSVDVRIDPGAPRAGNPLTITAEASDPSGITQIQLWAGIGAGTHSCTFSPPEVNATCSVTVRPPVDLRILRYSARTWDDEGYEGRTPLRTVIIDNVGPDLDDDGIEDEVERSLCTDPDDPDTDRDGLKDGWELLGLTLDNGGFVDLPAMGASPCWADVLLQYDYERGARLDDNTVSQVINAFRSHGIRLKVEEHERPRPPTADVSPIGAIEAAFQRDDEDNYYFDPVRNWTHYYAYSRHRPGRSGAWGRYFTFDINWDGFRSQPRRLLPA